MESKLLAAAMGLAWQIIALSTSGISAQVSSACAEDLIEQSRIANLQPPYAARGPEYCDGAAAAQHGGRLELRSMTHGPVKFGSDRLELALKSGSAFFVRGLDLRQAGSYRLDGDLSDGKVLVDLNAAIKPMAITPEHIGIYAWRKEGISTVYAPLIAGGSGPISVVLRSPTRLRAIRFAKLCPVKEHDCETEVVAKLENSAEDALIRIELPSGVAPGRYRLTVVTASTAAGDFPTGSFDFDL